MPRTISRHRVVLTSSILAVLGLITLIVFAARPPYSDSGQAASPQSIPYRADDAHLKAESGADPSSFERAKVTSKNSQSTRDKATDLYGRLPLAFEVNRGQSDQKVKFVARGQGYGLQLTSTGALLSLNKPANKQAAVGVADSLKNPHGKERALLEMRLLDANPSSRIVGDEELPGKVNYFVGNDRSKWRTNLETYSKVRQRGVYPGTDLVYYGNQRQLEYDFVLAAGADPNRIKLSFAGADKIRINQKGDLILSTPAGEVIQHKPFAYQNLDGERREVSAVYRLEGATISFDIGSYDRTEPLTIDPVLVYSTFTGGERGEMGLGIAVDAQGNAFLAGSIEFLNASNQIIPDAFVIKLNPAGSAAVYTTYVGGSGFDAATSIALDAQGNAYVTGFTDSSDFPVTAGAFQGTKEFGTDGFVTKLNASGSTLTYSTFLGGDNNDIPRGIAVSTDGRAYVAGSTDSTRIKTTPVARVGNPVYQSTNSGANWSASIAGMTGSSVVAFVQHPTTSSIVYAATNSGLFKTTNSGANWSITGTDNAATAPKDTTSIVIDPANPNIVYAGTAEGVYKSTNDGGLFTPKNNGLFVTGIMDLVIDPVNPATLYAGTLLSAFKTTDGGESWEEISDGINGGFPIVTALAIDPINPATVYMGTTRGLYKSTNGGMIWTVVSNGPMTPLTPISALAIDPINPLIVYAAVAPGGINKTTDGATWVTSSTGLQSGAINTIAIDRTTTSNLYASIAGRGIYKSTNSGANWTLSNAGLVNLRVTALLVDRTNSALVYAGTTIGSDVFAARLDPAGSSLEQLLTFGGNELDEARGVALDSGGLPYIIGSTTSSDFPVTNALQSIYGGSTDAFVAKLNASGSGFLYNSYLGGSGTDQGRAIAVRQDKAYVVGSTNSQNFPVANAFQPTIASLSSDLFLTTFNPAGSALEFSTYFGGTNVEQALGIALDTAGRVYITGVTSSVNFPTLNPTQPAYGGSSQDAFVTIFNSSATSLVFSTYLGGSSIDQGNAVAVDSLGDAYVIGTSVSPDFPTVNPIAPFGQGGSFVTKIGGIASSNVQFTAAQFAAGESDARVLIEVSRSGDSSGVATVGYATSDTAALTNCNVINGVASSRCDYATSVGTLRFAAGETSKTISIPIVDDAYAEGNESFTITLSGPTGGALGSPASATVTINDNETVNGTNPIDQTAFFVRQQYVDFLGREPDPPGFAAWQDIINNCPPNDTTCDRIHVSSAFFRSPEFQERGYFVYRFYPVAFGRKPDYVEFIPDLAKVSGFLTNSELEAAKLAFIAEFMSRQAFMTKYNGLNNTQYVDTLLLTADVTSTKRDEWIAALNAGTKTRAEVLRELAESTEVFNRYFNQAFVVMQYFGYLRRDPDALYLDWIEVLDTTNNFRTMVNGFMNSPEYRFRFGP